MIFDSDEKTGNDWHRSKVWCMCNEPIICCYHPRPVQEAAILRCLAINDRSILNSASRCVLITSMWNWVNDWSTWLWCGLATVDGNQNKTISWQDGTRIVKSMRNLHVLSATWRWHRSYRTIHFLWANLATKIINFRNSSILLTRFLVCSTSDQVTVDAFGNLWG
jgi:hypothetical protein